MGNAVSERGWGFLMDVCCQFLTQFKFVENLKFTSQNLLTATHFAIFSWVI
jgi:hypothetical protein